MDLLNTLTAAAQQPAKPVQNPSIFITFLAWLLNTGIDIAQWTAFHGERMLTEYRVLEWLEDFVTYSSKKPFPAIMLGLSTFVCGVPVFFFICFAIFSSIITFTGFLFIEGTLLTIGFGLLVCFLLVIGTIVIGVVTFGTATYLGIHRLKLLVNKVMQLSSNDMKQTPVFHKPNISVSDCKSD